MKVYRTYIIRSIMLILVANCVSLSLQADGDSAIFDTAQKRLDENLAAGKSAACALDAALQYFNGAYLGVGLATGLLGGIIGLPIALGYRRKLLSICSNNSVYNEQMHAYGVVSNKTDSEITIEVSYAGFCQEVKVPARTDNYLFGILPQHWYGLKCRIKDTKYAVYGYRGTFVGGGLAALAARAYGGDLSIIDGQLRLTNACGLKETSLNDTSIPKCSVS